jgi:amino acid transporter
VSRLTELSRRVVLGRKLRSSAEARRTLRKRVAVPVFGSDGLSSLAYSPDELLLTLAAAGVAAFAYSVPVAIAVALVLVVVSASYRQTVQEYPSGGGDYEVAARNLGQRPALLVGSAMLVDYVLVLAVSMASAAQYLASAWPWLQGRQTVAALVGTAVLVLVNLRGVRRWRPVTAVPTYFFLLAVGVLIVWGWGRTVAGDAPVAESADLQIVTGAEGSMALTGFALGVLVLRAFAVGSVSLTGVQTTVSAAGYFAKPRGRNTGSAVLLLGVLGAVLLVALVGLARVAQVRFVENPQTQLLAGGLPVPADYEQVPVLGQLARAVFDDASFAFVAIEVAAVLILLMAAHVAFTSFPVLGSQLARDGYLPRSLHTRSDRLAFSNGILSLGVVAAILLVAVDATLNQLIQMYIVGVFVSFTVSQAAMLRHWGRRLRPERRPDERRSLRRRRLLTMVGLVLSAVVLVVVLVSKFALGAWVAVALMAGSYLGMSLIRRHYDEVADEVAIDGASSRVTLPSRVHAIVLVAHVNRTSVRAVTYARAANPNVLEAITVDVDPTSTRALMDDWDRYDIPVPLRVLDSPYREITRPVLEYVRGIQRSSPRDVVAVFVPEYVVRHWWEKLLHNTSTAKLVEQLSTMRGVMITSVPWQGADEDPTRFRDEPVVRRAPRRR